MFKDYWPRFPLSIQILTYTEEEEEEEKEEEEEEEEEDANDCRIVMIRRSNVTRLTHVPGDLSETHSPQRPDDSSGGEEDPFHKPLLLPRQRFRVQFLYQLISTSQSQMKMTFPWDQVLASLWTFPLTTPKRRSLFPLRVNQPRRSARQRRRPARYDNDVTYFWVLLVLNRDQHSMMDT